MWYTQRMPPKPKDLTGIRFGKLIVLSLAHGGSKRAYNTKCDCGREELSLQLKLTTKRKTSCQSCIHKGQEPHNKTHGLRHTPTYETWAKMKQRCTNPNDAKYPSYGGRGISICSKWFNSFENFFNDMGHKPEGMTIGRINNDGNYSSENC